MVGRGLRWWLYRYAARRAGPGSVLVSWACLAGLVVSAVFAVMLHSRVLGWVAALLAVALCMRRYFRGYW
ncbi:hypothetical protein [Dactylosporangium sp. NPDC051484]|uniref:hypothetical protein n=1 Tax=Dactylosporangium sp. NPDC051484 TaxID=3154942 RepID=UPI00344ED098